MRCRCWAALECWWRKELSAQRTEMEARRRARNWLWRLSEALWRRMWGGLLYVGRGGLLAFAVAALDIALWDLRGLRLGQPLWKLAGGTARPLPAYGSGVDLPKPLVPVAGVKKVSRPLTRVQKLARALKACRKQPRRRRAVCEKRARRRYGAKVSARKSARRATTDRGAGR